MKTLEQILIEKDEELKSLRGKLQLKHNGRSDNHGEPDTKARVTTRLVEGFRSIGLSEREARVAAGLRNDQITEAIDRGDSTSAFWESIKAMRD